MSSVLCGSEWSVARSDHMNRVETAPVHTGHETCWAQGPAGGHFAEQLRHAVNVIGVTSTTIRTEPLM